MAFSQLMLYEASNMNWNDCYELSKDVLRNDKGISYDAAPLYAFREYGKVCKM